ncbi:MAG: ABC transporter permease [Thermoplasmatota archaeon]
MSDVTLRGIRHMLGRNLEVYRATWKMNALPPLVEPLLYLVAMGYGLGLLIEEIGGVSYAQFIAPAIVAITMMQTAFMETTYSSYVRMIFQRTWEAVMATPLSAQDILWGEVYWAATRATINATLMSFVVAAFGLLSYPTAFAIPVVAFFVGLMFAGLGLFVTAKVKVIDQFSYAFFLFVTPQFLFSGTFFPLEQLPEGVQWLALAVPLTHAVGLTRGLALGDLPDLFWVHVAYLAVASWLFAKIAVGAATKRIVN